MFTNVSEVAFVILFIWTLILTYIVISTKQHYHRLVSSTKKYNIEDIIEKLISDTQKYEKEIDKIHKNISKIEYSAKFHFQKISLVRFNPFERIGGDQSFVMALLNSNDSGIVINFIYTREGIRVYAKKVSQGRGVEYDLSAEEKEAIKKSSPENLPSNLQI